MNILLVVFPSDLQTVQILLLDISQNLERGLDILEVEPQFLDIVDRVQISAFAEIAVEIEDRSDVVDNRLAARVARFAQLI